LPSRVATAAVSQVRQAPAEERDAPTARPSPASDLFASVRTPLAAVDEYIHRQLGHQSELVGEMGTHLLGGGKRLRPALVLLSGLAVGADAQRLVPVAAACEIIHMATLVHDDLIDESDRRRGVPTVHAKWGVPKSVLIGDHLFAKGFSTLASLGDPAVVRLMSEVVSRTCAGEIEEIQAQWDLDATVEAYFRRVHAKTGFFIAECCRMGAVVGRAAAAAEEALATYGREVGDGFQVVDDVLDLTASAAVLGKPTGSDLRAGVLTLPVIRAIRGAHGPTVRRLLAERPLGDHVVAALSDLLRREGMLDEAAATVVAMARRAQAALGGVPDTPQRQALFGLAEELAHRVS